MAWVSSSTMAVEAEATCQHHCNPFWKHTKDGVVIRFTFINIVFSRRHLDLHVSRAGRRGAQPVICQKKVEAFYNNMVFMKRGWLRDIIPHPAPKNHLWKSPR